MKFINWSSGVHHKLQNGFQWCKVACLRHEMLNSPSMVYTTKCVFSFSGVHHEIHYQLRWCKVACLHHKMLNSPSMVYTTKRIFSFGGVHHEIHNQLQWCKVACLHHEMLNSPSMVYTMKRVFSFGGVHHETCFQLQWCTPRNYTMEGEFGITLTLRWCTQQKSKSVSVVYTTKFKIPSSGVSLHHRMQNPLRWCKVGCLHHRTQNPLRWCKSTPPDAKSSPVV